MTSSTHVPGRRGLAGAAALAPLLALGGCKGVTGRIWLPVYSGTEDAVGRVYLHFTADCVAASRDEPLVRLRYVDAVAGVAFDAEGYAPLCSHDDAFYGMYGEYVGSYYPDVELETSIRARTGAFRLEIVGGGGGPGYSEDDYVCLSLGGGGFERYKLPARDDVDGDGRRDEGCSYIGGGTIQINLESTAPPF